MAVTLTVIQAAADRRLGDGVNAPEEPVLGRITRYLAAATALVENYAPDAPEDIQNTAASLIVGYLYDAPVADGPRYANSLANSGAQLLLSRWEPRGVAFVGGDGDTSPSIGGIRRVGSDTVNVATARTWTLTALPVPTDAVIGVEILFPDGTTTGVQLFANTLPDDAPVTVGDADDTQSEFSVGRTSGNRVALASSQAGTHTITIWTVG